jgi:hypothetical protein
VWEFVYTGNLLETPYYFSLFNAPLALVLGSILFVVSQRLVEARLQSKILIVMGAAAALALPTFVTYRLGRGLVGPRAAVATIALMALSIVLLAASRFTSRSRFSGAVAGLAIVVTMFAVGYAASSGTETRSVFGTSPSTYPERRQTLSLATQLIRFMKENKLQSVPAGQPMTAAAPAFWYRAASDVALTGMQSTYLWGITWVGLDMPKIDAPMRALLDARRPQHLVLLCLTHACSGADDALASAGYANTPVAERQLVSHGKRVWVRALMLSKFRLRPTDPFELYYRRAQAPFSRAVEGSPIASWSFRDGAPAGWSGSALDTLNGTSGKNFPTTGRQWDYELISPKISLEPGRYRVYLSGGVSEGGLDLGVLDSHARSWIEQRLYWFKQRGFNGWMMVPFRLDDTREVSVILSNWVPHDMASRWSVRQIKIVRVP